MTKRRAPVKAMKAALRSPRTPARLKRGIEKYLRAHGSGGSSAKVEKFDIAKHGWVSKENLARLERSARRAKTAKSMRYFSQEARIIRSILKERGKI